MKLWELGLAFAEQGWVPDALLRAGIRRLCRMRLQEIEGATADKLPLNPELPLAVQTDQANQQHYELPPEYFELVLGRQRKYSCCYWEADTESLDQAEANALRHVCANAALEDGQRILDLGCGWGSLTLWLAEHYPAATIVAVSNSARQREAIQRRAEERNLTNVQVLTLDVGNSDLSALETARPFDRIVSIEMIEHVRQHALLVDQLCRLLANDGRMYFHFFCHRRWTYLFEEQGETDWITRYFFRGGMMPARDLFLGLSPRAKLLRQWDWPGTHYQRTAEAWLQRHDSQRAQILERFAAHYGSREATRWFQRWRMFYLAVAELFGYHGGQEWSVTHCLLQKM